MAVVLEDGREFSGKVVSLDLESLQIAVGDQIVTLQTKDIKKYVYTDGDKAKPAATAAEPAAAAPAEQSHEPAAPTPAAAPAPARAAQAPVRAPAAGEGAGQVESEELPLDIRNQSRLKRRIAALDAVYPWLCPADPAQWASLGILLFAVLSLIVHGSVVIAGAETASFGRSMGLAVVYLVAAFGQVALVPSTDVAVFSMLFGNSAVVMFALRALFGLPRGNAFVAFAVQAGFSAVAFGILQLVDSLLRSVGTVAG